MEKQMKECKECKRYTLKENCPKCNGKTETAGYKFIKFTEKPFKNP
jgi:RNA polymerase subunit RPABC4/transcription elongation factor Spt4